MKYIIESRLDTDWYKFIMGQLVFDRYADILVKYSFKNRTTGILLTKYIDEKELRDELNHIRELKFKKEELNYLSSLKNEAGEKIFTNNYLKFFENLKLPAYELENLGNTYRLEFKGLWAETIYWETPVLAVITELYGREALEQMEITDKLANRGIGQLKLAIKAANLAEYPNILFSDFGTRRRFSKQWQEIIVKTLMKIMPKQFIGTSNVELAMKYNLQPIGTMAHEMFMAMSGIFQSRTNPIFESQKRILKDWWEEYGTSSAIALTDTFGTDFFLKNFSKEEARKWKGLRQDSGDPFAFAEKAIVFYKEHGINPKEKIIVFSDGLTAETIITLHQKFSGRVQTAFGWGTNLTNDLNVKPLSLVIKLVETDGCPVVKLSDNIAKAIGDPEEIERIKKLVNYNSAYNQACVY
ncbi:MAG: nicotinate phosphoribosyltransferase [Candidatus Brennerbacteria bacterium]|nr:nicotinate phosphoribosyltransferase [Candidatus Brennerbacteria bacterium]